MIPYDAPMVTKLLRAMSPDRLATVVPRKFQMCPCAVALPAPVLSELISNERARRRK